MVFRALTPGPAPCRRSPFAAVPPAVPANGTVMSTTQKSFWLTKEAGVATIPVSAFYKKAENNQVLRFCFAKRESTLEEAVNRLVKFM